MHRSVAIWLCLITAQLTHSQQVCAQYILAGQTASTTYVDLLPDKAVSAQRSVLNEAQDSLDLDADGRYDLRLNPVVSAASYPSYAESRIMPMHDDVAIYSSSQSPYIIRFAGADTVQQRIQQPNPTIPPNVWGSRSTIYQYGSSWLTLAGSNPAGSQLFGQWLDGQDGYLGVRLRNGPAGTWRYGWVRVQSPAVSTGSATIVIKDYALSSTALSQNTASSRGWHIYPIPTADWLTVKPPTPATGQLIVVDAVGRARLSAPLSTTGNQLDISSLAEGVYILQIKTATQTTTERIIKQ
jgi:hypothetical protein